MAEISFAFVASIAVSFIVGVLVTRWIFGIDKIISSLKLQNEHGIMQIRLLKKMLINQGTPIKEIDDILEHGNKKE